MSYFTSSVSLARNRGSERGLRLLKLSPSDVKPVVSLSEGEVVVCERRIAASTSVFEEANPHPTE
jgi:hypothetical protein